MSPLMAEGVALAAMVGGSLVLVWCAVNMVALLLPDRRRKRRRR